MYVHLLGLSLLLIRVSHLIGVFFFKPGPNVFRIVGAVGQLFFVASIGIGLVIQFFSSDVFIN